MRVEGVSATLVSLNLRSFLCVPLLGWENKRLGVIQLDCLRAGLSFLARTPSLRSLFLVGVPIFTGLGLLNALLLPFSLRILHATEFEYSTIEALCSVGHR